MPNDTSASMQQAKSRLETAMERLERAIQACTERSASQSGLTSELDAARAEIGRLKETNKVVSARLDAAIGRVKAVLQD